MNKVFFKTNRLEAFKLITSQKFDDNMNNSSKTILAKI